jgi:hypothetical protein
MKYYADKTKEYYNQKKIIASFILKQIQILALMIRYDFCLDSHEEGL